MKFRPIAAALLAGTVLSGTLLGWTTAFAHDDAWLDTQDAPHGGQLRMAGPYHYELVVAKDATPAKDSPVVVHVTDHAGAPVSTAGASGSALFMTGKSKASIVLRPDGDNRMRGAGRYASASGMKVVVSVSLAGAKPQQARFTPGETKAPHSGHDAANPHRAAR